LGSWYLALSRCAWRTHVGEHDEDAMNTILKKILSAIFYVFFSTAYIFLKILKKTDTQFKEPDHLMTPPDRPIESVKLAWALNPKTDLEKLRRIAKSEDVFLRRALLRNPSLPLMQLRKLAEDADPIVRQEAKNVLDNERFVISDESPI
jgi:hypothetical protein